MDRDNDWVQRLIVFLMVVNILTIVTVGLTMSRQADHLASTAKKVCVWNSQR